MDAFFFNQDVLTFSCQLELNCRYLDVSEVSSSAVRANFISLYAPKELWEAYSNRTVPPSVPLRIRCISPTFFEVGIPNLIGVWMHLEMTECHVQFSCHCDPSLSSDLVLRIIVSGANLILFEVGISNLVCGCILG